MGGGGKGIANTNTNMEAFQKKNPDCFHNLTLSLTTASSCQWTNDNNEPMSPDTGQMRRNLGH